MLNTTISYLLKQLFFHGYKIVKLNHYIVRYRFTVAQKYRYEEIKLNTYIEYDRYRKIYKLLYNI